MEAQEVRENENVASGERRSSISELRGALKRVTLSPFHSKYKSLVPSNSESSKSSVPGLDSQQESGLLIDFSNDVDTFSSQSAQYSSPNETNPFLPSVQNGTTGKARNSFFSAPERILNGLSDSSSSVNPFSAKIKDSNLSTVDGQNKKLSSVDDIFSSKVNDGWPHASASAETVNPWKVDVSPVLPAENDWAVFPPLLSNQEGKHLGDTPTGPPSWLSETPQTGLFSQEVDIFQPYKANEASGMSHNVMANENTEPSQSTEKDYLLEYILANQNNENESTLPSNGQDIFQDTSIFVPPPAITDDIFQTSDRFTEVYTSKSSDIFQTPFSNAEDKSFQNTPIFETPTSFPSGIMSFDPLSNGYSANDGQVRLQDGNFDNLFTTTAASISPGNVFSPAELNTGLFKEEPPLNASTNGGLMFRRLPPKPISRNKVRKNSIQARDHQVASQPTQVPPTSIPSHPTTSLSPLTSLQSMQAPVTSTAVPPRPTLPVRTNFQNQLKSPREGENNGQVYEDVLFIGQEICVEDWPEDSPELSPDWKPTGKLKLRRESMRISTDAEREFIAGNVGKKNVKLRLSKKLRSSVLSRRGSKDKLGHDTKVPQAETLGREPKEKMADNVNGGYSGTLPWGTKFHDVGSDHVFSSDPDDHSARVDSKPVKKKTKKKYVVPKLHYRNSKTKSLNDVPENGSGQSDIWQASKEDLLRDVDKLQREGKLGNSEEKWREINDNIPNQKEPLQFHPFGHHHQSVGTEPVPEPHLMMNDFLFLKESKENTVEKTDAEKNHSVAHFSDFTINEVDGATGYTPSWEPKDFTINEKKGATGYTPSWEPKSFTINEEEGAAGYTPSWEPKVEHGNEIFPQKDANQLPPIDNNGNRQEMQDVRPKKPLRLKVPRLPRRSSKSTADEVLQKGADLFKASDVRGSESEEYSQLRKPPLLMVPPLSRRDSKGPEDIEHPEKGADLFKAGDYEDDENWMEEYNPDTKPPKFNSHIPNRDTKVTDHSRLAEDIDPPGATSSDFCLSEAAKAEWMSSQMDVRRSRPEEEERLEGVEEEEEGDTDSLMEWWNTVELWDELPPNEEITLQEDETKSFTEIAGKVHRGLRVFYKVFTEQAEVLYQHVLILYAIADDLSNFHRRAKIANITGSTTTAVGGVAAIAGLALAPVTFGASLIVSAVGLGVATAGGITAASAAISDNVHDMNDRKKIEIVVQDYETRLTDLQCCLNFVAEGIRRLHCHPLLRRNNYYAGDWEVRRALQTINLVTEPVQRAEEIVNVAMLSLNNVYKGMDKYFSKDSRELKKGCKKEVMTRVRMLAKQLHDGLVELTSIREQLLDASGNI